MKYSAHPIEIRAADESDLEACLQMDDSYASKHAWQVEPVRGEPGAAPYTISSNVTLGDSPLSVTFRPVRLPRARRIAGTIATLVRDGNETALQQRLRGWASADLTLVAVQDTHICGYIVVSIVPGPGIGWISALVVDGSIRERGIGSMLLTAARRWARYNQGQNMRAFMLELQTRNYPAVSFCRKQGFVFCGYTDYSFSNGDVVLLFASPIVI
jgi:ribosomal protein S18 acetylase RimI-like enzyme